MAYENLRASDQDRENVAATLREHYAQGRLTIEEFEERNAAALAARTMGDLAGLTNDLPIASVDVPPQRSASPFWLWLAGAIAIVLVAGVLLGLARVAGPGLIVLIVLVMRGRGRRFRRRSFESGARRPDAGRYAADRLNARLNSRRGRGF